MTVPLVDEAQIDGAGRLVTADARLIALNTKAGGGLGQMLAVPQLATIARLAQVLRIPIARGVIAADGGRDLDLWVQARPADTGVALRVSGWTVRSPRTSWLVAQPHAEMQHAVPHDWRWTCDAGLRLTDLVLSPDEPLALRPADVVGAPLTRLLRLIENDDGDMPILAALASARAFTDQRAVRRDRPDAEVVLSGRPLFDESNRLLGFTGNATAVAIAALPVAEAPSADHAFTARLGLALRAPLDRIVSRAETIGAQTEGPLRRDYADYAGDIASAGRHLLALVDDLADLDAVERPDFAIAGEVVDLADIARRAAGLLAVRAADRQVRIDRPDGDEVLLATGDFRRVLQILVNLLGNAVRYTPPGGMVWLRTEREGDSAVVVVADQGKGIATDDHARVFDKFERVDVSEPGGSGLGLYISRRLARAMGGDITLDSAPGQGARFVLTLPVA